MNRGGLPGSERHPEIAGGGRRGLVIPTLNGKHPFDHEPRIVSAMACFLEDSHPLVYVRGCVLHRDALGEIRTTMKDSRLPRVERVSRPNAALTFLAYKFESPRVTMTFLETFRGFRERRNMRARHHGIQGRLYGESP